MPETQHTISAKQKDYSDLTFVENIKPKTIFEDYQFDNCRFKLCDFSESEFTRCQFVDCDFVNCNLSLAQLRASSFLGVNFEKSKLVGINWSEIKLPQIKLLSPLQFYECNMSHSSFFELSLTEMNLEACKAHEVDFREADLSLANFRHTDFSQSLFIHTNLMGADFTEAVNYTIDPTLNKVQKAKFSFPEVVALLAHFEIEIRGVGEV